MCVYVGDRLTDLDFRTCAILKQHYVTIFQLQNNFDVTSVILTLLPQMPVLVLYYVTLVSGYDLLREVRFALFGQKH